MEEILLKIRRKSALRSLFLLYSWNVQFLPVFSEKTWVLKDFMVVFAFLDQQSQSNKKLMDKGYVFLNVVLGPQLSVYRLHDESALHVVAAETFTHFLLKFVFFDRVQGKVPGFIIIFSWKNGPLYFFFLCKLKKTLRCLDSALFAASAYGNGRLSSAFSPLTSRLIKNAFSLNSQYFLKITMDRCFGYNYSNLQINKITVHFY